MTPDKKYKTAIAGLLLGFVFIFTYLTVRLFYFIIANYSWEYKAIASLLLAAELFGLIHSVGYFINIIKVLRNSKKNLCNLPPPALTSFPPVAIVVPSYKEPIGILKDTLVCFYNLTYPNKQLYLLDDSRYDKPWDTAEKVEAYRSSIEELCQWIGVNLFRRKWRGAKAGIINDFLRFLDGRQPEDLQFTPCQSAQQLEKPKYILVFDADMNPFPDFVEALVAHMENQPKAAFIQTPQYYSNFELNKVAKAAGLQQAIFFEYICEGKGQDNAMFCCGTNVLIRREALMSIGGFDESSVTEDFATSLFLHLNGWKSLYYNKVSAFGMGPEDLGAYFKQQFRWSLGTLGLLKKVLFYFVTKLPRCSLYSWWEYFLSSTHYLIGFWTFIMFLFPMWYLFFSMPLYFMNPKVQIAIFFPYIFATIAATCWALYARNFSPMSLLQNVLITAITFPVYIKATIYAFLGIKSSFTVTPKDQSTSLPLTSLWPQLTAWLMTFVAITWGINRLYYEGEPVLGLCGNILFCIYNFAILSSVFYFNNPEVE